MASIVEFVFAVDVEAEFDSIKGKMQLPAPPSQSDYGTIVDALDKASESARMAMQLHVVAKSVLADIATTRTQLDAPLYQAAAVQCAANKDAGKSGAKTITNEDVKNMAFTMFPDDLGRREEDHNRAKRAVEYLEGLVGCWNERVKSLRQMVATARS